MLEIKQPGLPEEGENNGTVISETEVRPPRPLELFLIWAGAFVIFLLLMLNILVKLNPPTGDEPFYLMTAISILEDRDIDETNNYAKRQYYQFSPSCEEMNRRNFGNVGDPPVYNVPGVLAPGLRQDCEMVAFNYQLYQGLGELPPHFSKVTVRPGSYTKHGLGLSFLIAPFYALGGRAFVVIFIAALAALLGVNIWLLGFETTGSRKVAWVAWGLTVFSTPILCFAFLIFPAIPAALFVTYAWRRLRLSAQAQQLNMPQYQPNGTGRALLIGLCIGFLPWLHSLYLFLSAGLGLYWLLGGRVKMVWQGLRTRNFRLGQIVPGGWSGASVAVMFLPLVFFGGLFLFYYIYYFGTVVPNTQDHAGFAPLQEVPVNLLGLLFDQKYGLLIYAPYYLLALVGLVVMGQRTPVPDETVARRSDLYWLGIVAVPYLLVIGSYLQWWGEWGPPARYLMPVVPLLAVSLSIALVELNGRFARIFTGVSAAIAFLLAILFMYNPHVMFNWQTVKPARSLEWLRLNLPFMEDVAIARFLPSYVTNLEINNKEPNWAAACIWLGLTLLVGIWLFASRKYARK
jgi:hypothetical protein